MKKEHMAVDHLCPTPLIRARRCIAVRQDRGAAPSILCAVLWSLVQSTLDDRCRRRRPTQRIEGIKIMQLPKEAMLLRIFIGESKRDDGLPLYESIVMKARERHLAGATVLRGPMGYGHSSRLHTAKILRLSGDLPLVIEIVDTEEKIISFPPSSTL